MFKVLAKIGNKLDSLGLTKEADLLDSILMKLAVPIEGIFEIHPDEPIGYEGDDWSDEEIEKRPGPIQDVKRKGIVLRDEREREYLKYRMERSRLPIEEEEELEKKKWYDSLKELGDHVILIPFDKTVVERNEEMLRGFGNIFGLSQPKDYKDFFNKTNLLYGNSAYKIGDRDRLKSNFPSLWNDISRILNEKGIGEDDAVYMLYNQQNSPDRSGFTKDPHYLAHDIGHSVFDSEDGDPEFKDKLNLFLRPALSLYLSEDGEPLIDAVGVDNVDDNGGLLLANFFNYKENETDIYADIFKYFTSGTIDSNSRVPDSIEYEHKDYDLKEENKAKVKSLLDGCILGLKSDINPGFSSNTYRPGPLSYFAGSVVLQDV